ncbi:MAG TPA: hypothetical protein G4O00_12420 [Thermoflexia bacterium]|nr:hypothetical protein [Thermoflexia bacterium]
MTKDLDHALDESLTLLAEGRATLEECLARYPEHAAELRPLLETALQLRRAPRPTSRPAAFAAGKQRMLQALEEKKRRLASPSSSLRRPGWIAALLGRKEETRRGYPSFQLRWVMTAATALILLVATGFLLLSWLQTPVARAATLAQVSGVVEILPEGEQTWRPAAVGERVEPGDRIRTGPASAALLRFFNGSTTDIGAETVISVVQMSSRRVGGHEVVVLHQWVGESYYHVQPLPDPASEFKVETPAAITRVRGTVFAVIVEEDGTTDVVVIEGKVDVIAQERVVQVPAGQGTTVQPEHPPVPARPTDVATPTPWPTATPSPTSTLSPVPTSTPSATPSATPYIEEEMPEGHDEEMEPTEEPTEESDHHTPEPTETPEESEEGEDRYETPEPTETPDNDQETPEPTEMPGDEETPEPTKYPGDGGGDNGTPEPSPTPGDDDDHDGDSGGMDSPDGRAGWTEPLEAYLMLPLHTPEGAIRSIQTSI